MYISIMIFAKIYCYIDYIPPREWRKIEPEVYQNLVSSIPQRSAAVRRARGRQTKY